MVTFVDDTKATDTVQACVHARAVSSGLAALAQQVQWDHGSLENFAYNRGATPPNEVLARLVEFFLPDMLLRPNNTLLRKPPPRSIMNVSEPHPVVTNCPPGFQDLLRPMRPTVDWRTGKRVPTR